MTPQLNRHIILRHTGDRRQRAILHTGFVYRGIVVCHGLVTDGLSVPWFISFLFGRFGKYLSIALVHDCLYTTQIRSRKEADRIFYDGLREMGCGYLKARFAHISLRCFGGIAWRSHAPE